MSNRRKLRKPFGRQKKPAFNAQGRLEKVDVPNEEKTLLKQVPAKAGDVVVGVANLYDDGSVDVMFDKDAPPEAIEEIRQLEKAMMSMTGSKNVPYSLGPEN